MKFEEAIKISKKNNIPYKHIEEKANSCLYTKGAKEEAIEEFIAMIKERFQPLTTCNSCGYIYPAEADGSHDCEIEYLKKRYTGL